MATNYNLIGPRDLVSVCARATHKGYNVVSTPIVNLVGKAINDTFTLIYLPKGHMIQGVALEIYEEPNLAAAAIDIGAQTVSSDDITTTVAATFCTDQSIKFAAGIVKTGDGTMQSAFTEADTLYGLILKSTTGSAALTAGKVVVHFAVIQL